MDVVLGVAVMGPVARLALVGSGAQGADVIDESAVDLVDNPIQKLTETVVGTKRLLADQNHRLLATRLCWSDPRKADQLRRTLEDSGVQDVAVLSESQAANALSGPGGATASMRGQTRDDPTVVLARGAAMSAGLAGDATAMAPAVGGTGDATAMAPAVGGDGGATAMAPAVGGAGDATAMAPAVGATPSAGQVGPELAYSLAGDSDLLPMEWLTQPEEEDDDAKTGPVGLGSRRLAATDAVLGIAVAGSVARLALVGPVGGGYAAIKHLVVELPIQPFETLIQTATGVQQALADEGRHLVATRLYAPDQGQAEALRQALAKAGFHDVGVVSEAHAVTALLRTVFRGALPPGAVAVVVTTAAATLVALGAADALATVLATVAMDGVDAAAAAADMLLDWLGSAPFAVSAAYVMGTVADPSKVADRLRARSALRVEVLERPEFAFARGAALAAGLAPTTPQPAITSGAATAMTPAALLAGDGTAMVPSGDETAFAPAAEPAAEEQQLAYSMAEGDEPLGIDDEYGDDDVEDPETAMGRAPLSRRSLVVGNAVIAFAVIGLATLAAAVAITVRPTASARPVVGHQNAAPGKFMPLLPTQQQAPVPPPPPDQPFSGFQGGIIPDANGYIPPQLASPGSGGAPVPVPGFVPNPNPAVPMPVPVPYPGWHPPYPYPYPNGPTTTFTTPTTPATTTTPPTTTPPTTPPSTPPTTPPTTTQPPVTTTVPTTTAPHVTTAVPTTQQAPKPMPTTAAPPPVTKAPAPQTIPTQPHTQQPVVPQQPVAPKPPIVTPHH